MSIADEVVAKLREVMTVAEWHSPTEGTVDIEDAERIIRAALAPVEARLEVAEKAGNHWFELANKEHNEYEAALRTVEARERELAEALRELRESCKYCERMGVHSGRECARADVLLAAYDERRGE